MLFAPVVEPEGPGAYLTRWPADAYANNAVEPKPWIFGQTAKEGHFETYCTCIRVKTFIQRSDICLKYYTLFSAETFHASSQCVSKR